MSRGDANRLAQGVRELPGPSVLLTQGNGVGKVLLEALEETGRPVPVPPGEGRSE